MFWSDLVVDSAELIFWPRKYRILQIRKHWQDERLEIFGIDSRRYSQQHTVDASTNNISKSVPIACAINSGFVTILLWVHKLLVYNSVRSKHYFQFTWQSISYTNGFRTLAYAILSFAEHFSPSFCSQRKGKHCLPPLIDQLKPEKNGYERK